jgi:hypothetical protein
MISGMMMSPMMSPMGMGSGGSGMGSGGSGGMGMLWS